MNCAFCGRPLRYLEEGREVSCQHCGRRERAYVLCPEGHFLCEACHGKGLLAALTEEVLAAKKTDPRGLSLAWLKKYPFPMLGCEHAYLAAAALLGALSAAGYPLSERDLEEVFARTEVQARGGFCGLTGVCGIVPALGAVLAYLLGSRCGTDLPQREVMHFVGKLSQALAELTGPGCCKAYLWKGLALAVDFLRRSFPRYVLRAGPVTCLWSERHPHGCRRNKCPYWPGTNPLKEVPHETRNHHHH